MVWHVDNGHDNGNNPIPGMSQLSGVDDAEVERHLRSESRCLVSTDSWKVIVSEFGEYELYDLASDPYELTNLAPDPAHAGRLDEMSGRLESWQSRHGDPLLSGHHSVATANTR